MTTIAEMEAREASLMAQRQELKKSHSAVGEQQTARITAELRGLRMDLAIARAQQPQEAPPAPKSGPRLRVAAKSVAKVPRRAGHELTCNRVRSHEGPCSWRTLAFTVPGEPLGKMRPRFRRLGAHVSTYTPAKTRDYEATIAAAADVAATEQGYSFPERAQYTIAVRVHRTYELKGPDLDNVLKLVGDALNGVAWKDDAQVVEAKVTLASTGTSEPRIEVAVYMFPYVKAVKTKRAGKVAA